MYNYKAKIKKVVDGDTVDAEVDLGFNMTASLRFRIKNVDTPEIWRPRNDAEYQHGMAAKLFVESLLPVGSIVNLVSYKEGAYNRWEADIKLLDGRDVATTTISEGFQKKTSYE